VSITMHHTTTEWRLEVINSNSKGDVNRWNHLLGLGFIFPFVWVVEWQAAEE